MLLNKEMKYYLPITGWETLIHVFPKVKRKQPPPSFELGQSIPFPITVTLSAPPIVKSYII